jgi:cytochrome c oxidase assembly protein Cox11
MKKHSKNCTGFLVAMIFFLLMAFASIPLYIMGFNKMSKDMNDNDKPIRNLFTGFQFNTELTVATVMSSIGITTGMIFLFLYLFCK